MSEHFDPQPYLKDDIVIVRALRCDDWHALFAVAADRKIWEQHPAHDRWKEPVFRSFFDEAVSGGMAFAICDAKTQNIIGSSRYGLARAGSGEVEIGWTFLAPRYWGGAANWSMKRLLIGHALQCFDRCIFLVGRSNIRSRRAMEKIGGVLTERVDIAEMAGKQIEHVVYAIDRENFRKGPLS